MSLICPATRPLALALVLLVPACVEIERAPGEAGGVTRWGDDLLGAGADLMVAERVERDAMLAGGEIRFSGSTGGDYIGAGGRQEVDGQIEGNARAAGGEVTVSASVQRNATLAGGSVVLGPQAVVGGNLYLAGGRVAVEGEVEGHLRAAGGEVVLAGPVAGDVNVEAGRLRVAPGAVIGGALRHRVPADRLEIDPAAEIAGEITALEPRARPVPAIPGARWIFRLLRALAFLLAGAALVALFPGVWLGAARAVASRPGASAGFGVVWLIALPVAAGVVFLTVIGIPLALILLAAFAVVLYLARAAVAIWIGRRLLGAEGEPGRGAVVGSFLLGAVLLLLVGLVPIAGPLVTIVATIFGIGALLLALARPGTQEAQPAGRPAAMPPPA